MIARVHQSLGDVDSSLAWAQRCLEISNSNKDVMEDFDLAYAQEGLARAYALAGDQEKALYHWKLAKDLGEQINDPEDKKIFLGDFQRGNWHQLQID